MINCNKESKKTLRLPEVSQWSEATDGISNRFYVVLLNGQLCIYDIPERKLYMWLKEGPYYRAGKNFAWPGSSAGLGANGEILRYATEHRAEVRVFVRDQFDRCYEADPKAWLSFAREYNAIDVRKGVLIYLYQWKEGNFRTIRDDPVLAAVAALLQGGGIL